jgi:serine/threonine-protein phosphatase 2A regulatory subunit A
MSPFLKCYVCISCYWGISSILTLQVVEKTVKPCLVELSEDPDVDVRYYANQALQACDQMMVSS